MKEEKVKINYVKNDGISIKIICVDELLKKLKMEYGNYYTFDTNSLKVNFNLYIYINKYKYESLISSHKSSSVNNFIYLKDRDGIIISCKKDEIFILYNNITDNLIQFIGENLISIFGLFLERSNYSYFHAACVEKNSSGIVIIGERNSGKTTILNYLLQSGFNFVSNSHLALKKENNDLIAVGSPSRVGIRLGTLSSVLNPNIKQAIMEKTEFADKFLYVSDFNFHLYSQKKFNIKVNELQDIYNIKLINKVKVSFIIIPLYFPELEHIRIIELTENQKAEVLQRNRRCGSYDTIRYLSSIFENPSIPLLDTQQISIYKIYQNEKNIDELFNFINLTLKNGSDKNKK